MVVIPTPQKNLKIFLDSNSENVDLYNELTKSKEWKGLFEPLFFSIICMANWSFLMTRPISF